MADDTILDEIVTAVRHDGVYVAPALREQVSAEEEAAINAAVARSDVQVKVIAVPLSDDDMFQGSAQDLMARVHDAVGGDGWYVATDYIYDTSYGLDSANWGLSYTESVPYDAITIATGLHPHDLGAGLVELTTAIADGTVDQKIAEANGEQHTSNHHEGQSAPAGTSTATTSTAEEHSRTGAVVGGVSLVLLLVVGAVLVRRRRRTATGFGQLLLPASRRQYRLPVSVIDRVRDADAERIATRADREVLALGERIDTTDIADDADTSAWQAALDHYDAARRVLGDDRASRRRERDLLDDVGAIVLAERGGAALDAALSGHPFVPTAPCFLNPLHGPGTARRVIVRENESLEVPLCRPCRQDLAAGRLPGILDTVRRGKPVHYFDAGVEPWSTTGYGALHDDLVARLQRGDR